MCGLAGRPDRRVSRGLIGACFRAGLRRARETRRSGRHRHCPTGKAGSSWSWWGPILINRRTFVAVDEVGRRLAEVTLRANSDGHLQLVQWASRFEEVTFALEDCRHLT